jgi:hypothetical protein
MFAKGSRSDKLYPVTIVGLRSKFEALKDILIFTMSMTSQQIPDNRVRSSRVRSSKVKSRPWVRTML